MHRLALLNQQISQKQIIYSVPVGPKIKGQTQIHRHPACKESLLVIPKNIKNLADFWDQTMIKHSQNKALEEIQYEKVDQMAKSLGSWLLDNKHKKLFLYAKNCPEWTITDLACWNYGVISIPLYDTLGSEAFSHIIKLTEGSIIFTTNDLTNNLFQNLSKIKGKIQTVVYIDSPSAQNIKTIQSLNLQVLQFKQLLNHKIAQRPLVGLDNHLTYNFTSGTTGLPKGVIGTHRAAISQCLAMEGHYEYQQADVHLSFLPVAHTFERFIVWVVLHYGANVKYSQFPITQIPKDFARAKPTVIPMVPRLLNKFYPLCKNILEKQKSSAKIKGLFGGRIRMMVTGSAPISPEILTFFKNSLECDLREGYGQTETTAASFVTYSGDTNYGHVGGPNRATQFKLVDVPQMNYLTSTNPPRGQICTRGDSVFKGYYLDEQNTKQTIDEDGWNHSGDVGVILPNGALQIIDRKKNIYKLSQGQYIAPEKIQNIYLRCPYIAECFIYGDSLQNCNIAVVHPNPDVVQGVAKKLGINQTNFEKLVKNKQIEQFILKQMIQHGKKQQLLGFQLAKRVRICPVSFGTLGIFTSTMKLQRHIAKQAFQKQIQEMYKEENQSANN